MSAAAATSSTPGLAPVDLRSDTVTRPTPAMREAMCDAPVGDDVFGDDPTVNALQDRIARMLGKEAALFMPSGTQSNLAALMSHCQRGDEYLVGQMAHTYRWEGGGGAVLGSVQPQPIAHQADGTLSLHDIEANIKPDDAHFARTRLLCLENTLGGKVMPLDYLKAATGLAHSRGLGTHLDGARLFNAAVGMAEADGGDPRVHAREIADLFDTVSVCFSKGLGAPVGSALVGTAEMIQRAHRVRKMTGGAMRQAGILAAGALHALDHHIDRLADDHANARRLAQGLADLPGVTATPPETNIVFVDLATDLVRRLSGPKWGGQANRLIERLHERGVWCTGLYRLRFVTHLDVSRDDIERAIVAIRDALTPDPAKP
jgi:threonine aldolase